MKTIQEYADALNRAWISAMSEATRTGSTTIRYQEVLDLIKSTTHQGFMFSMDMEPNALVQDRILKSDRSQEFLQRPEWKDLGVITQMMDLHPSGDYPGLHKLLQQMQSRIINDNIRKLAPEFVKENGPFFVANDQRHIRVACFSGDLLFDSTLIILLHSYIIHNGTIAQCA